MVWGVVEIHLAMALPAKKYSNQLMHVIKLVGLMVSYEGYNLQVG